MNLHFYFSTSEIRVEEAKLVNAEIKELLKKYPSVPIFLTGDYNSTIETPEYAALTEGIKFKSGMLLTDDNDGYMSGYHQPDDPVYETTGAIDHICVTYDKAKVIRHRKLSSDLLILSTDHDPIFIDVEI